MKFKELSCKNFGTFKNLSYQFKDEATLIQGENLSDDSQESNGSGKSFIQAAIEYALFKTTSRKVNDIELINYEEDEAEVTLTIECPMRKEIFKINRVIRKKGSSILNLMINDEPVNFATVNDGNKLIIEWIGISAEDLQNYYIINKERFRSIFSSSNREKVEIIGRFSRASLINGVDKIIIEDVNKEDTKLSDLLKNEVSLESRITVLGEQLQKELDRDVEKEKEDEIKAINSKIDDITNNTYNLISKIDQIDRDLPELSKEKKSVEDSINEYILILNDIDKSIPDFSDEYDKIDKESVDFRLKKEQLSEKERELRKSLREVLSDISSIEKNIKGSVRCPKCSHEFNIGDPTIDIEEERKELETFTELSNKINSKLSEFTTIFADIEDNLKVISNKGIQIKEQERIIERKRNEVQAKTREFKRKLDEIDKAFRAADSDKEYYNTLIKRNNESIEFNMLQIEDVKKRQLDSTKIDSLRDEIKLNEKKVKSLKKEIEAQQQKIYEITQWMMNFKKFNVHLANISLTAIQANCNKFLKDIKSDIQIRWEGYKVLANKTLKEEITPYIIRDNVVRDFWSFSGGERARMEYAMIFTLQKMINSTNKYGGLSFLSTDEIAEGIDSLGLNELMKSFEGLNKTVLITTHVVNRSISSNVLMVRKENNVSKII